MSSLLNSVVHISGSPLRINVDDQNGHYVTAYGIGLTQGGSGEHLEFFLTGSASEPSIVIVCHNDELHKYRTLYDKCHCNCRLNKTYIFNNI